MKAKVYGSSQCVWCDRVAKMLEDSGAVIEKVDISQGKEIIKEMQEAAGEKVNTVPQVIIDGKYVGGYTEVERYINVNRL